MSNYFDNKDVYIGPKMNQYGSHMVMTDVQRHIQTKYVTIDTRFRDEYNDNFEVNYNLTLDSRVNNVRGISVTQIELPMFFYNISPALENNSFRVTNGVNSITVKIPEGNYDLESLEKSLQTQFCAQCTSGPFIDLSLNIVDHKMEFFSTSFRTFVIDFDVDTNGDFSKYNFRSRLGWILGFRQQQITVDTNGVKGVALVNINTPRYLNLIVSEFNSRVNRESLARVVLDRQKYPFGTILPANHGNGYLESEYRTYNDKNDLLKLNVRLEDEFGRLINMNGHDISFQLRVDHE